MKTLKRAALLLAVAMLFGIGGTSEKAEAGYHGRYYRSWTYYPRYRYHYTKYYYTPTRYHYCMYYPSYSTRYVYYYNPYKRVYWGRFDLQGKGDKLYSELATKDRKEKLKDIPDSAFPAAGKMPTVPETEAKEDKQIKPLPEELLGANLPKDAK